ncbi:hypothetical protein BX666DRAFT_1909858 [Dichotomocladium elegans]|nr:hypothetical protein BX666DRAFT_1909858 [Dichotomocladium elegans]
MALIDFLHCIKMGRACMCMCVCVCSGKERMDVVETVDEDNIPSGEERESRYTSFRCVANEAIVH